MTMQNEIILDSVLPATTVYITRDHMEYSQSKGSKGLRNKKGKRRRNHRTTQQNERGNNDTKIPSIFRVENEDEALTKSSERSELSRLILPKLENNNQADVGQERAVGKCEDKRCIRHTLPKITTSPGLTTRPLYYTTGPNFGEQFLPRTNSPIDDRDRKYK